MEQQTRNVIDRLERILKGDPNPGAAVLDAVTELERLAVLVESRPAEDLPGQLFLTGDVFQRYKGKT